MPTEAYEKDLKTLEEANPQTADEVLDVLLISGWSLEGYYVSLVFDWLKNKNQNHANNC